MISVRARDFITPTLVLAVFRFFLAAASSSGESIFSLIFFFNSIRCCSTLLNPEINFEGEGYEHEYIHSEYTNIEGK
jgi:hypothetical protein